MVFFVLSCGVTAEQRCRCNGWNTIARDITAAFKDSGVEIVLDESQWNVLEKLINYVLMNTKSSTLLIYFYFNIIIIKTNHIHFLYEHFSNEYHKLFDFFSEICHCLQACFFSLKKRFILTAKVLKTLITDF